MTVYLVHDFDPMNGSHGAMYLARIHATADGAQADMNARNQAWLKQWRADTGEDRLHETWNWQYARCEMRDVDDP